MSLLGSMLSSPTRLLARAKRDFGNERPRRAERTADRAIRALQRRVARAGPRTDAATKALLSEAWFLKGRLQLQSGERQQAFRSFFACPDRVPDDAASLAFVVGEAAGLGTIPSQLYALLVEYVANAEIRRTAAGYREVVARVRALLRPDPAKPGSIEALEPWNAALAAKAADCGWCHYHLGIIATARQDWHGAIAPLRRAVELDPRNESARNLFAFAALQISPARDALAILKEGPGGSRGTLLLRAHLEQLSGDLTAAARTYAQADAIKPLGREHLLALAEILVRLGRMADAREALGRVQGKVSAAGRIVQALAGSDAGPVEAVRKPLVELLNDATATKSAVEAVRTERAARRAEASLAGRSQAAAALLAVVARHPGHANALAALEDIPQAERDERYRLAEGACHAAQRNWAAAAAAWSAIARDGQRAAPEGVVADTAADAGRDPFERAHDIVRLNILVEHYNAGELDEVLQGRAGCAASGETAAEADRLCVFTLARLLQDARSGRDADLILEQVEDAVRSTPQLRERADARELIGSIFAVCGRDQQALETLRDCERLEPVLTAARAALRLDQPRLATELLRRCKSDDPRRARLLAVAAAKQHDFDGALAALGRDSSSIDVRAAILFLADRTAELEDVPTTGGPASYFKAVNLLRSGRREAATAELHSVDAATLLRADCEHLLGWIKLGDAADALRANNIAQVQADLIAAARYWPGPDGATATLPSGDRGMLSLLITAGHRSALRDALIGEYKRCGFADPKSCHRLAVLHLAEGHAALESGRHGAAVSAFEAAIACLAVALPSRAYLNAWQQDRAVVYNYPLPGDLNLEAAVCDFCSKLFQDAAARMKSEAASLQDQERRQESEAAAEAARLLPLALEGELHAARLLRDRGGFEHEDRKLVFGPAALAESGLAEAFALHCLDLKIADAVAEPGCESATPAAEIERFFSVLRIPALLLRKGDIEGAQRRLETQEWYCFRTGGSWHRGDGFTAHNPAFAREDGASDLMDAAEDLKLTMVLKFAESEIRKEEPDLGTLKSLWSRAAKLGQPCGRTEEVVENVTTLVRGRLPQLENSKRLDFAHAMVDAAFSVVPSDQLQTELVRLTNYVAVKFVNEKDDYTTAVGMLRRAYALNPHQSSVRDNLLTVLERMVGEILSTTTSVRMNTRECLTLTNEAIGIATSWLEDEPGNHEVMGKLSQLLTIAQKLRRIL